MGVSEPAAADSETPRTSVDSVDQHRDGAVGRFCDRTHVVPEAQFAECSVENVVLDDCLRRVVAGQRPGSIRDHLHEDAVVALQLTLGQEVSLIAVRTGLDNKPLQPSQEAARLGSGTAGGSHDGVESLTS